MSAPVPSTRLIAKLTGFSKATVANALNGSPTVARETARRILKVAQEVGYQRNPMIGTLMSAMRRSQSVGLRGVLAMVDVAEPERPAHGPFHKELVVGARARAEELGFKIETYVVDHETLSYARLNSILTARGIRGIIVQPSWKVPDFSQFDWSSFVGVYTDYVTHGARLHSVCCDHYRSILEVLETLHDRGYRRPGLIVDAGRDERVHLQMSAALHAFQQSHPDVGPTNACIDSDMKPKGVIDWLRAERPDVVLSQDTQVLRVMQDRGMRIPETFGYVCLNRAKAQKPCASLDRLPGQIGACAVELLVAQIHHNAWGMPRFPMSTTICGQFVDGPTLKK
jgi:LacI family transcriptional regulator